MKYDISSLTHILYMADIALQVVYEIIAFAIPIHHSIEGICCTMSETILVQHASCNFFKFLLLSWIFHFGL